MTHRDEILYFSVHGDGTKVWERSAGEWELCACVMWRPECMYVVDNQWAELRKAQMDGKQLERAYNGCWNEERLTFEMMEKTFIGDWRIKPKEPVKEWLWAYKPYNWRRFTISEDYMTYHEAHNRLKGTHISRIDSSERVRG